MQREDEGKRVGDLLERRPRLTKGCSAEWKEGIYA
jgi:hypothetical protein